MRRKIAFILLLLLLLLQIKSKEIAVKAHTYLVLADLSPLFAFTVFTVSLGDGLRPEITREDFLSFPSSSRYELYPALEKRYRLYLTLNTLRLCASARLVAFAATCKEANTGSRALTNFAAVFSALMCSGKVANCLCMFCEHS